MKKVSLLIFFLAFAQNVWMQRTREPLSEEEQKLSNELKRDQEYIQVTCARGRKSTDIDKRNRFKALEAFEKGNGKLKLKKTCGTIEGDPIVSYLTAEKGKVSVFVDTSHDDFGPKRVYSYQCNELEIGVYFNDLKVGRMVFQKAGTDAIGQGQAALRCIAGDDEIIF